MTLGRLAPGFAVSMGCVCAQSRALMRDMIGGSL